MIYNFFPFKKVLKCWRASVIQISMKVTFTTKILEGFI